MAISNDIIETIPIPEKLRKQTTLASMTFYDKIEIYKNRVSGWIYRQIARTWFYKDYVGIEIVNASLNSQFAQVVFLTGHNSKNTALGIDLFASQNINAYKDTNRFVLCGGMFSYAAANEMAEYIVSKIRAAFEEYKNHEYDVPSSTFSPADELKKFKELFDTGVISQEEFEAKKKQLLSL